MRDRYFVISSQTGLAVGFSSKRRCVHIGASLSAASNSDKGGMNERCERLYGSSSHPSGHVHWEKTCKFVAFDFIWCAVRNRASQCFSQQALWKCSCMRWSSFFFCNFSRNPLQAPCETKVVVRISCSVSHGPVWGLGWFLFFCKILRREPHSKKLPPYCFNFSITSPHNHCLWISIQAILKTTTKISEKNCSEATVSVSSISIPWFCGRTYCCFKLEQFQQAIRKPSSVLYVKPVRILCSGRWRNSERNRECQRGSHVATRYYHGSRLSFCEIWCFRFFFFRGFGYFCLDGRMWGGHIGRNVFVWNLDLDLTNTRSAKASPLGRALQTAVIAYGPMLAKVGNV